MLLYTTALQRGSDTGNLVQGEHTQNSGRVGVRSLFWADKKAVLSQGNRAMPQLLFLV